MVIQVTPLNLESYLDNINKNIATVSHYSNNQNPAFDVNKDPDPDRHPWDPDPGETEAIRKETQKHLDN